MHAMRVRERKHLHRGRKGRHRRPINKTAFSLSGARKDDVNKLVLVRKYTQTRQRWLKGKIVKSGHDRRYKKTFTVPRTGVQKNRGRTRKEKYNRKTVGKQGKRKR